LVEGKFIWGEDGRFREEGSTGMKGLEREG